MEHYFSRTMSGYHFNSEAIKTIEEHYGAKYVGYFLSLIHI